MELKKIYDITYSEDKILSMKLSKANEAILFLASGKGVRLNLETQQTTNLFSVNGSIKYRDGGFDTDSPISIYTLDDIVVVANTFKRHAFVYHPNKTNLIHLWRGEYYCNISRYPIALYKDQKSVPHIIYANDWNHVQIMNLETLQVLTATKSLIKKDAIKEGLEYCKNHEKCDRPWPSTYDYFYGWLLVSPNQKYFLSKGWVWGSSDAFNVYDIETFINENTISEILVGGWDHQNRPACWIDEKSIAVFYNPQEDGEEPAPEIQIYSIENNKCQLTRKVQIDSDLDELFFDDINNTFICIVNDKIKTISDTGQIIYESEEIKDISYNENVSMFTSLDNNRISVYNYRRV